MVNDNELAAKYLEQNVDSDAIAALALIAAGVEALGYETVSRVFIDYSLHCIPEDEYKHFLVNIICDNGFVEE